MNIRKIHRMDKLCTQCHAYIDALNDAQYQDFVEQLEKDLFEDDPDVSFEEDQLDQEDNSCGLDKNSQSLNMSTSILPTLHSMERLIRNPHTLTSSTRSTTRTQQVDPPSSSDSPNTQPCTDTTE